MLAWGAADAVEHWPSIRVAVALAAAFSCFACMVLASQQAPYWKNTETLFQHAVDVTPNNWMAEGYLGSYLMKQPGRRSDAVDHLEAALRIDPDFGDAHNNLGLCLLDAGLYDVAKSHFETAMRLKPGAFEPLSNLGLCFMMKRDYADAIPYFTAALRAKPDSVEVLVQLGTVLSEIPGRDPEAVSNFEEAIRLKPDAADARDGLGFLLARAGRTREAISQLEAGQRIQPKPQVAQALEKLRNSQPH
jgi:tetratricopeptide (TPR) repeat protein